MAGYFDLLGNSRNIGGGVSFDAFNAETFASQFSAPALKTGTLSIAENAGTPASSVSSMSSSGLGAAGAWGGIITGTIDAVSQVAGNVRAYKTAKENFQASQINAFSMLDASERNAALMRAQADRNQASNLAQAARTGLATQAYDNLMLSDRFQVEKDVLAMKEEAQFQATNLMNSARRIKSRQKRKATVSTVLTFGVTAPLAIAGAILGGPAGAAAGLQIGNAITGGVTNAMSDGR